MTLVWLAVVFNLSVFSIIMCIFSIESRLMFVNMILHALLAFL